MTRTTLLLLLLVTACTRAPVSHTNTTHPRTEDTRPVLGGRVSPPPVEGIESGRVVDRTPSGELVVAIPETPGDAPPARVDNTPPQTMESRLLLVLGEVRRNMGLGPLRLDPALAAAARDHSADMLNRGYFEHISPEGGTPEQRVARHQPGRWTRITETLWRSWGFKRERVDETAQRIIREWLASPHHRPMLIDPTVDSVGAGWQIREGMGFATLVFGRR